MPLIRKIKFKMIDKGKIGKYLIYAIGEVILIAVGIFLAVQINNWKQESNDEKLEQELLDNIWTGLQGDLEDIRQNNDAHNRFLKSQIESIKWIEGKSVNEDSLIYNLSVAHKATSFLKSDAAFESLKEFGLNRISNDTLRFYIVYLYDVAYPNFAEVHKQYHRTLDETLDLGLVYFEDWSYEKNVNLMVPVDEQNLKKDRKYLMKLKYLRKQNDLVLLSNNALKSQVSETIRLIENSAKK